MFEVVGNRLRPTKDVEVGGYGREDVLVYKGAPVAFSAIERRLREMGVNVKLRNDNGVLVVEGEADMGKVVKVIEEILLSAERDLLEFERIVNEAIRSYMRKLSMN